MSDSVPHRPMSPDFPGEVPVDLDRTLKRPVVVGYVLGESGTSSCRTDEELAEHFGSPVVVPSRWPDGSVIQERIAVRDRDLSDDPDRYYMVTARHPDAEGPLLVHGYMGEPLYSTADRGCVAVPALSSWNAVLFDGPTSASLSLSMNGLSVSLLRFPSAMNVVDTASSLRSCHAVGG